METSLFKEYLEYFNEKRYIQRDISIPKHTENIITVVGPRRVGKTWLLLKHAKERDKEGKEVAYVNFDDPLVRSMNIKEIFQHLLKEKYDYIYLDEIQNIPQWDLWLRRLQELKKENIFVTGSSSELSQQKIPTTLRGRYISYLLLPFSFKEIRETINIEEYVNFGGFPEIIKIKEEPEIRKKHISLIETIFYKDIVDHYKIRNIDLAKRMLDYYLHNYSNITSISKLSNLFNSLGMKVSKKTIWQYDMFFENSFFFFNNYFYTKSYKKRMQYPHKKYIIDHGIISSYVVKVDRGRLIENIVYLELLKREKEISYYKTKEQYEIDFVVSNKEKIEELIQVSYDITKTNVFEREIRALLHAKEDLKLDDNIPLTIITWDYEDERTIEWWRKKGKIRFIPLWKWLLDK